MPKEKYSEYVGLNVTKEMDDCLRLMSAMHDTGKGAIIRDIIETHMQDKAWTVPNILSDFSMHLYSRWYFKYRDKKNLDEYLKIVKDDLKGRQKLPKYLIDAIVKQCKETLEEDPFKNKSIPD